MNAMASAGHPGGAGEVDQRQAQEHRAVPGHTLGPPEPCPRKAERQHPGGRTAQRREQQRQRLVAAGTRRQRGYQCRGCRDGQDVGQPGCRVAGPAR